jgi:hypothetical protein
MRLVVILLNSRFTITRSFLCHLCVDLGHSLRHLLNLDKLLRFDKVQRRVDGHVVFSISASGVVSACPVKTCIGVLLFRLVDKEFFRTL